MHSHKKVFSAIPFFNCADKVERRNFVVAIAGRLQRRSFVKHEMVCRANTPATAMYILVSGIAGRGGAVLRKGEYFGADMLIAKGVTIRTVIAMTFIECIVLGREDVLELLEGENFPLTKKLVRRAAFKMVLNQFYRKVGIAKRMEANSKRMTKEQIEDWKARVRQKSRNVKRKQKATLDTPARFKMHEEKRADAELASPKARQLKARLPEGVQLDEGAANEVLTLNAGKIDKTVDNMQAQLESAFQEQLNSVLTIADKRTDEMAHSTEGLKHKTEVLAKQLEQLQSDVQKGFDTITAKFQDFVEAVG